MVCGGTGPGGDQFQLVGHAARLQVNRFEIFFNGLVVILFGDQLFGFLEC